MSILLPMIRFSLLSAVLLATAAAQNVPDSVILEKEIVYSQGSRMSMDIARPKALANGTSAPAVLAIHGGGFQGGSRSTYLPQIIRLAQHGYVAATVDYRLAPRSQFPAAVQDVKAAVRFLRAGAERFTIDPER